MIYLRPADGGHIRNVVAGLIAATVRSSRLRRLDRSNPLVPYTFLLPHALAFGGFVVFPVIFGVWISLHRWNPLADTQSFVGLQHYGQLFDFSAHRALRFWGTFANTLIFVVLSVPPLIALALGLALLLERPILGRALFRTVFFFPVVLSVSVMAILWRWIFEDQYGLANLLLQGLGLNSIPFVTTEGLAWIPIVVGTVWWTVGFNMTLYLAALGGIPASYYEAAEIDGAGAIAKFRSITWPMLMPTTLFVLVTTIIASFQLYGQSQLITGGGPTRSTQSVMQYITEVAFTDHQLSSATAMSMVFGVVLMGFTALQFRLLAQHVEAATR